MLREKAPGTFSHSKNVASMLETIGSDLGLDVIKLKIAGYFHDIGKVNSPTYFTENQAEIDNPHDKLEPWISHKIITSHVAETAQILCIHCLQEYSILEVIIDPADELVMCKDFPKCDGCIIDFQVIENLDG